MFFLCMRGLRIDWAIQLLSRILQMLKILKIIHIPSLRVQFQLQNLTFLPESELI